VVPVRADAREQAEIHCPARLYEGEGIFAATLAQEGAEIHCREAEVSSATGRGELENPSPEPRERWKIHSRESGG